MRTTILTPGLSQYFVALRMGIGCLIPKRKPTLFYGSNELLKSDLVVDFTVVIEYEWDIESRLKII